MVRDRVEVDRMAEHVWVVALVGEHDLSTADAVRGAIDEALGRGSKVAFDLSHASFIDSTVLAAMMQAGIRSQEQEEDEFVVVARQGSAPRRLFDLVGAALSIDVYESREAAFSAVVARGALVSQGAAKTDAATAAGGWSGAHNSPNPAARDVERRAKMI
jgi:anti-anti-sigma factor